MEQELQDSIQTQRLLLFPFTQQGLALFNKDIAAFEKAYNVAYHGEELDNLLKSFLKKLEKEIEDDPQNYLFFTEFLIMRKEDRKVIGSIDYKYVPKEGVTEVGYGLNPAYTGQGYMTEALLAFLEFGKKLGIRTVRADTLVENVKSQNVLKRCGFRYLYQKENLWWEKTL